MINPSGSGEATRNDFRTDVNPTLFIDNWGRDVAVDYSAKVKDPIDAAVALAQLMASIRNGTPLDPDALDCEALDGVAFFDSSAEDHDHFFGIRLEPRHTGGSYSGPRVSATFNSGIVRLGSIYSTYEQRWSTRRGDVIAGRHESAFMRDLNRINNAYALISLQATSQDELTTERPETWPGADTIPSEEAHRASVRSLSVSQLPIYLGEMPSQEAVHEPTRRIHIPFLDN